MPQCTSLLSPFTKKTKYCFVVWEISSLSEIFHGHLSSLPVHFEMRSSKFLRKINSHHIIWMLELLPPPPRFSLCGYQSWTGETRIGPFKNETEAEGLVLISFFSVSFSPFFFFYMKTNRKKCKNGNDNTSKRHFNFIHYDSHKLVELDLPSNFKKQRPGAGKKKQNPNKTKTIIKRLGIV